MFKPNTVFIVGAGASVDFGFPVGRALKTEISNLFHRSKNSSIGRSLIDVEFSKFLEEYCAIVAPHLKIRNLFSLNSEILEACQRIRSGLPFAPSIDNFIKNRNDDLLIVACAKAAIAWKIFSYERVAAARLAAGIDPHGRRIDIADVKLDGTWHQIFCEQLFTATTKVEIQEALSRVKIISFNYDRCIEQILRIALMGTFSLSEHEASILANQVEVLHPYGDLGPLAYDNSSTPVSYGAFNERYDQGTVEQFLVACRSIKSFYEEPNLKERITATIDASDTLVFLGFGYHSQNLNLLTPSIRDKRRKLIGTAMNMEPMTVGTIRQNLSNMFDVINPNVGRQEIEIHLKTANCYSLMDEIQPVLQG
ncbi:MAG: hypothetical protein HOO99_17035 [Hyphomicrobiaceae bacterium]|nr:hypothetical protein [Hyphomicrobiaceae bacterium]